MLNILKAIFFFCDIVLISASFFAAWYIRFYNQSISLDEVLAYQNVLFIALLTWCCLSLMLNLMHVPRTSKRIKESFWYYIFYPFLILFSVLSITIIMFNYDDFPRLFFSYFLALIFLSLIFSKKLRSILMQKLRFSGIDLVGLGIISNEKNTNKLLKYLKSDNNLGFSFKNLSLNNTFVGDFSQSSLLLNKLKASDFLIIDDSTLKDVELFSIIDEAEDKGVHIFKILNFDVHNSISYKDKNLYKFGDLSAIKLRSFNIKRSYNIINKRIFDFFFSLSFILLVYWWVYLIVSLIIKVQSRGSVIFKQERVGLDGSIFMCYKFRTMHIDSTNSKDITKIADKRIFSFGSFMRKVNLDEFPQFINVLKGDMSVVGPRPHMISEDNVLATKIKKYRIRRWVKPGITGYAAIKGYRGGTESIELMQKRIDLDIRYIEKWTFLLDLKICLDTFLEIILLRKKGH